MSYGYDSKTAFSKNVTGIHNVAEDLLDRLRTSRRREKCEQRPIILIAHSLGGLIVKKVRLDCVIFRSNIGAPSADDN